MPGHSAARYSRMSTRTVAPADRVGVWEDYNRRALVGLRCSPYSEDGLLATQTNTGLGGLRLADIAGNEHVVERSPQTCRTSPKDSVFASLLVSGQAVFLHSGGCFTLAAGDLVLYDTRRSYLLGFPTAMRQLLVDVPREVFTERCLPGGVPVPLVFSSDTAAEAPLLRRLEAVLSGRFGGPHPGDAAAAERGVLDLLHCLAVRGGPDGTDQGTRLLLARDHIDRHLADPRLCAAHVADALGISTRQLSRDFRQTGRSPSRHILERRLERARQQLADPASARLTVADIAHRWGFASQPHFTRVFREHFGRTPGEVRPPRRARSDGQEKALRAEN
ncbi:helix-turn-helix domain-containing protein [Streptomyces monomycini]|uniref:helix-turn-helix domain-containing protein n=1 Tax=Streptomyces monomycini TaxID=371720 RepID=UPI000998D73F|nr:helix-turn-helix domain-containing protein [Streptomyces monomycini]